jgi:hypothetical protein
VAAARELHRHLAVAVAIVHRQPQRARDGAAALRVLDHQPHLARAVARLGLHGQAPLHRADVRLDPAGAAREAHGQRRALADEAGRLVGRELLDRRHRRALARRVLDGRGRRHTAAAAAGGQGQQGEQG